MKHFVFIIAAFWWTGCTPKALLLPESYISQKHRIGIIIMNPPKLGAFPINNYNPMGLEGIVGGIIDNTKNKKLQKKTQDFDIQDNCNTFLHKFKNKLSQLGQEGIIIDTFLSQIDVKKLKRIPKNYYKYYLVPFAKSKNVDDLIVFDISNYGIYKSDFQIPQAFFQPSITMIDGKTNSIIWQKTYYGYQFVHDMPNPSKKYTSEQLRIGLENTMDLYIEAILRPYTNLSNK